MNVLQIIFNALWNLAEGDPFAQKVLLAAAEGYNRQMAWINQRPQ